MIDADPEARQRTVKVKIAAQYQPVLPTPRPGSPFMPVEFEGLTATPWVDASRCQGKARRQVRRAAWRTRSRPPGSAPRRGCSSRPVSEHKDAA